ncbi:hypothetical protein [Bradyrhizobium sp. BWA-3-5]|uniref:hypothetical protein n=1 Tax=Bradyrhizobium sp. BWA-3-5 TaxID=3080013 RepID=UPI00293F45CB|nr:hypothetical protein [Bradyrhizobium sp. BWA-3-5]WOH67119.1 hypothetical protein RX331_04960 [Bradyrhizobium sp. BWA-3-5]
MFVPALYLSLALLGGACSLYLTARVFRSAVRTGTVEAGARRVYDRVEHPEAFYGVLTAWVLIDAMMIVSSFVSLEILIEQFQL